MLFTKLHEFVALWSKSAAAERSTGMGLSDLQDSNSDIERRR